MQESRAVTIITGFALKFVELHPEEADKMVPIQDRSEAFFKVGSLAAKLSLKEKEGK